MKEHNLDRTCYMILQTLNSNHSNSFFTSISTVEIMEENPDIDGGCALGAQITVYKKIHLLLDNGYIKKGVNDSHAHTYYITGKGIELIKENEGAK